MAAVAAVDGNLRGVFSFATNISLPGWLLLALVPQWEHTFPIVRAIALVNAVVYVTSLVSGVLGQQLKPPAGTPSASFTSIDGVMTIFRWSTPKVVLACWVHYLVFDLVVGEFMTRDAITIGFPQWLLAPCLLATLMYGPAGLLTYTTLRLLLFQSFI